MNRFFPARLPAPPKGRYGVRLPPVPGRVVADRLVFTERVLLGVFGIAYLLTCSFPLFGVQLQTSFLKHLPLVCLIATAVLHFVGMSMNGNHVDSGSVFGVTWPFLLLAVFSIGGSAVARWSMDVDDTFIVFGVYLLLIPALACFPIIRSSISHWASALGTLLTTVAIITVIGAAAHPGIVEAFHELEYLVLAGFFLQVYRSENALVRTLSFIAVIAIAAVNHKLTGYIVGATGITYIMLNAGWQRTGRQWRSMYVIGALVAVCLLVLVLTTAYFAFRQYLPSGNSDVRLKQYDQALSQFVASPIWGDAYTGGSGEGFAQAGRLLNIPTHSDVLDMLKHGGLIAFGLFAIGYAKLLRLFVRASAATRSDRSAHAFFTTMQFFLIGAAITFAINPILLKGPYLVVIWGNAGLAVGLALRVLREAKDGKP